MTTPPEGLGLYADTPEDRLALFELIRDELTNRVGGVSPDVIRQLALIGTQHIVEDRGSRVVFRGPSGAGKTFLARTLADVLGGLPVLWGLPVLSINCGLLAEMNFQGTISRVLSRRCSTVCEEATPHKMRSWRRGPSSCSTILITPDSPAPTDRVLRGTTVKENRTVLHRY